MTLPRSIDPIRVPDFNGDGQIDTFQHNPLTGGTTISLIDNRAARATLEGNVTPGWNTPRYADFNGDNKTDLLWHSSITSYNVIWLMDGARIAELQFLPKTEGSDDPIIGDYNGDGKTDIFFNNVVNGQNQMWLMDGTRITQLEPIASFPGWKATVAEFNNDGKSDLFWRNETTAANQIWLMDGAAVKTAQDQADVASNTTFEILDYNGDGRSDILWRPRLGSAPSIWVWAENGTAPTANPVQLPGVGGDVRIQVGDFNGDNRSDFLARDPSTGKNQIWTSTESGVTITDIESQPSIWVSDIVNFNRDRFADIRWTHVTTNEVTEWLSDGTVPKKASP